jgi:hypothetical protein
MSMKTWIFWHNERTLLSLAFDYLTTLFYAVTGSSENNILYVHILVDHYLTEIGSANETLLGVITCFVHFCNRSDNMTL